ncbi:unnamed protein product [Mycena citricolor]|uniref:DUF7330 domain-containing protein n=1 Tax=Mycena citricolor TaxID=2018698 RepID=A0AAD2K8D6_9AGAR|nr:unnamed protein product [Mycena citricolor]
MDSKTDIEKGHLELSVSAPAPTQSGLTARWSLRKTCVLALVTWAAFQYFMREPAYPIPSDLSLRDCVSRWDEFSDSAATAHFTFGVPQETLLLVSKGAYSSGNLRISATEDRDDTAEVKVIVRYRDQERRDAAKVCLIERGEGELGVGLFTSQMGREFPNRRNRLEFDVELVLPRSAFVKTLETDVGNFGHDVQSLENLGHLSLKGSNGAISTGAISASEASLSTSNGVIATERVMASSIVLRSSNGAISGILSATESIDVSTSNGRVDLSLVLEGKDDDVVKNLSVKTSNSDVMANVTLSTASAQGGCFTLLTQTSNGRLDTRILSAPLDSTLKIEARTSNNAASLALPAAYEGSFSVATSNGPATVHRVEGRERDPRCVVAGGDCEPRERQVKITAPRKGQAAGTVYWDEGNASRGEVTLKTSNANADIYI